MSRRTLPAVTSPNFPEKVKEIIEIREGIRGSRMSGFVTFKDLEEHDPLRNQPSGPLVIQGDPPAAPSNLQIQAGMLGNTLKWDESSSKDVWYYEIWVANSQNRSEAELIAIVSHPNTKYVHSLDSGSVNDDHYYWIRAVNWSGLYSSWEPPDAQGGYLVEGSTSYSEMTSEILGVLQDRIVELNEDHFVENPYGVYNNTFYIALEGEEENHVFPFIVGEIEGVPTVGINGQLVVDGSIYADAIAADQITGTHIAANSIEASHIQAGAIEVGYDEITGDKPPVDADKTSADNVQSVISQVDIDNAKANGQTLISGGYINTDILQVDYGIIVGDKPPSDADKTSNNTAYDTSRVGGTSATTVRNNASTGASHAGTAHAPSDADNTSTVIGGGFITTGWIADSSSDPNLRVDFNNATIEINNSDGLKILNDGHIQFNSDTYGQTGRIGEHAFGGMYIRSWEGSIDLSPHSHLSQTSSFRTVIIRGSIKLPTSNFDNIYTIGVPSAAWKNVYSHDFTTVTHVPDMENQQKALDYLKNIKNWRKKNGQIDHAQHYACVQQDEKDEKTGEVKTYYGISLGKRCAGMEKMIYELNEEVKDLKNKLIKR